MLAPDSFPVTVSYHLYSVSSGRCRVTIPGRHLEEGDGLCIRCRFITAMGKIQRTHARVPLAHYIKRLTKKINRSQEPPGSLFHTLTVETRQKRSLGTSQYSHLVICQITFKSQTSQRASSPVRGESWEVTQATYWYLGAILAGQHFVRLLFEPEPDSKNWFHGRIKFVY